MSYSPQHDDMGITTSGLLGPLSLHADPIALYWWL